MLIAQDHELRNKELSICSVSMKLLNKAARVVRASLEELPRSIAGTWPKKIFLRRLRETQRLNETGRLREALRFKETQGLRERLRLRKTRRLKETQRLRATQRLRILFGPCGPLSAAVGVGNCRARAQALLGPARSISTSFKKLPIRMF